MQLSILQVARNYINQNRKMMAIRQYLPILLFSLAYFAIHSLYFGHLPIWDERVYYEDFILSAQAKPFDLLNYSGNHNAQLWLLLAGLPNYFFPYSYFAYHVWISMLSTTSVCAYYFIVTKLYRPHVPSISERILFTALFAFHPSVFANQVHVTADTGLLIFWLWFLLALLNEKTITAAIVGCFLLFSKETAMAHLPILFVFCALLKPKRSRMQWIKNQALAVLVPFIVMVLFLIYKFVFRHENLFFVGFLQQRTEAVHIFPDASLINYLMMVFILNFNWVLMLLSIFLTFHLYRMRAMGDWSFHSGRVFAFTWLFLDTLCVVLGVRHWANVRYLLPIFPVMLLYFSYVMSTIKPQTVRIIVSVLLLGILGWQNIRSIDPLSNTVFCTTKFGQHNVLHLPTEDICGLNAPPIFLTRDQLAYNLEFTKVPLLISDIMKDVRPDNDTTFVVQKLYDWELFTSLDANYEPTLTQTGVRPKIFSAGSLEQLQDFHFLQALPNTVYYIEFPTPEQLPYRQFFSEHYAVMTEKYYDRDGYRLTLLRFQSKTVPKL